VSEYLLEIGSGELPYSEVRNIPIALKGLLRDFFENDAVLSEKPDISVFSTPRRVVALVKGLPIKTLSSESEIIGPPLSISYRGDTPAPPLIHFMKKNGISNRKNIYILNQKRGAYIAYKKTTKGIPIIDLLRKNIPGIIKNIPFKKTMFWLNKDIRYPRPILWISSVFDGRTLSFNFGDVKSAGLTYIKKVNSYKLRPVRICSSQDYFDVIESNGVILKNDERKRYIKRELMTASKKINADMPEYDEDFIDEIVGLTETPYAVIGEFDKKFLSIPKELLSIVMRKHQRFFPLKLNDVLLPFFIGIADIKPDSSVKETIDRNVRAGYSKVLAARLADADFFFKDDIKKPLSHFVSATKDILFYKGLGSYSDKTERIRGLGIFIAGRCNFAADILSDFKRASNLLKFDLATRVVYEFPEMQGIIGKIYAKMSQENERVSLSIEEHYYPVSKAKKRILPSNDLSALCSISDKLDTIFSFVMLKRLPTGESDPFYLRRAMIGTIEIILDKKYRIDLTDIFGFYFNSFFNEQRLDKDKLKERFINFANARFKNFLISMGYKSDEILSVLSSVASQDFYTSFIKIDFLSKHKLREEIFELSRVYKRINNITHKHAVAGGFDADKLVTSEEIDLIRAFESVKEKTEYLTEKGDFYGVMNEMYKLKGPVDGFFDKILVLTENEDIRNSRIGLLNSILDFLRDFCNFSDLSY